VQDPTPTMVITAPETVHTLVVKDESESVKPEVVL
jgi:hypothetical protein